MGFTRDSRGPAKRVSSTSDVPVGAEDLALPGGPAQPDAESRKPTRLNVWLHRLSLVIFVAFCVETGILLTVLPWKTLWVENSLLNSYPTLRAILRDTFVRGAITGLGLVDIWIGIWEAVHYRDPGKSKG